MFFVHFYPGKENLIELYILKKYIPTCSVLVHLIKIDIPFLVLFYSNLAKGISRLDTVPTPRTTTGSPRTFGHLFLRTLHWKN
jgi:hypothetical protein